MRMRMNFPVCFYLMKLEDCLSLFAYFIYKVYDRELKNQYVRFQDEK